MPKVRLKPDFGVARWTSSAATVEVNEGQDVDLTTQQWNDAPSGIKAMLVVTDFGDINAATAAVATADDAALTSAVDAALTTSADAALTAVAVATTAATSTTPFGYAQAQADAIVTNLNATLADLTALRTKFNLAVTDLTTLRTAYNQAQADIATLRAAYNTLLAHLRSAGLVTP